MAASDHINPEQHEPREPRKQTKQWSRARKKPSIREASIAVEQKKRKEAIAAKARETVAKRTEFERLKEWSEKGETLDRSLLARPIVRTKSDVFGFAAAPTEENEVTLSDEYKRYLSQ